MKNLFQKSLFLCAFMALLYSVPVHAQGTRMSKSPSPTQDTITANGTYIFQSGPVAYNAPLTVQVNVTKLSGTVAGTATLQVTADGDPSSNTYVTIDSAELVGTGTGVRTLTDGSAGYQFHVLHNPGHRYRVSYVSSGGTQSQIVKVYYLK